MEWLVLVAVFSASHVVSGLLNSTSIIINNDGIPIYPCLQVNHRESDIDSSMMGQWYVIEVIQHQEDPKNRFTREYETCPKLNLYMTSPTFVRILWQEKSGDINYTFKMVDPENRGFWMAWGKQSGSMLNKVYDQFSGSVQVLEAVPSRMVLTFCSSQPPSSQPTYNTRRHFSIIMVRNATMLHDTRDIHQTFSNFRLPEIGVQQTCRLELSGSDATKFLPSFIVILSSALLLLLSGAN